MFDSHLHTTFSTDSRMTLEEALSKAKDLQLGLIVTEHMDLKYPKPNDFIFDVDEYFKKYSCYRNEKLLLGIEMGLRPDCVEENKRLHEKYDFDYIIGSVHLVNGIDIYEKEYYEGRPKLEAYEEYFEYMLKCVKLYDFIDSLGHIDYIARYARYSNNEIYYKDYSDIIDEIMKELIKKDIVMELNTRRLLNKETVENLIGIYKRYGELGGKYVTMGSDSHSADTLGHEFAVGGEIAQICGLKIVHFKERKIIVSK